MNLQVKQNDKEKGTFLGAKGIPGNLKGVSPYITGGMNLKPYRIVLVGCGYMGASHLDEIYYRDNIEITGVVDVDEKAAQRFVKKYNAHSSGTDYRKYLSDDKTDIFIIATYPSSHLAILKDCLKYNKHVLCEKPIAATADDGLEFAQLVRQTKSKVLVGHILRHNSTYNEVAKLIHSGAIGSPIIMRMVQNKHSKDWDRHLKLINHTSPIIDCGVHYIDVMQWFTKSRIVSISGIGTGIEEGVNEGKYNYGMFCARLEDGSVGYYEAGWGNTIASEDTKEFIGPKGRIRIVYRKDRSTHQEEGDLIEYYLYPQKEYRIINVDSKIKPTWEQLKYLIQMIEEDIKPVPGINEVSRAFEIALAADEAIKTGETVELHRREM